MNKKRGGFSYIEIIIALAMFMILLAVALPSVLQSGRNMELAESHYGFHLSAQAIMLAVRDALQDGECPQNTAAVYANKHGVNLYGVWVLGANGENMFYSDNVPNITVGIFGEVLMGRDVVVVVVWNDIGYIAGRAVGVL